MPLANSLLTREQLDQPEFMSPLAVVVCRGCSLLQITCEVPPENLFRNYAYFSSFSDTTLTHARELALRLVAERRLGQDSFVVEVASNDGYLLQNYNEHQIRTLGIEPALNVAAVARERGVDTITEFFCEDLAKSLAQEKGRADVIHGNNVMAHVPDINGFLAAIRVMLKDDGIAVIEVPYVVELVDNVLFDTIYHEHVFYFSVSAIDNLCKRNNLVLKDIERLSIHGGSLRLFMSRAGQPSAAVGALLAYERERGFDSDKGFRDFTRRVATLKADLSSHLKNLKNSGKTIAAYGAAAKGSTLLNFFKIGNELIDFVVDRSTAKQGLFMPGVRLPIYPPEELLARNPDYVLLLTWNFAQEILQQQREYLRRGGRFILPIPKPTIVTFDSMERVPVETQHFPQTGTITIS